jgi:signal peptidase II
MGKWGLVAAVALGVLLADQLTKSCIRATVELYESIPVVESFFHITHVRNPGGAFSFLAGVSDGVRVPLFYVFSTVAIGVLLYFLLHVPADARLLLFALAGILGGALGNLIDRVAAGEVTDFFDFHVRGHHWPAFNVADSFITIGVVILVAHSLFARENE